MKKNEIKIGEQYTCKVSDKIVVVKIVGENPHGGWDATNLKTGKAVRIKSAQRLRSAKFVDQKALDAAVAEKTEKKAQTKTAKAEKAVPAAEAPAAAADKSSEAQAPATTSEVKEKKMGLVSATIQILKDGANAPMNVREMVEQVTAKGLWSPARGGKTPAASLYASIFREIKQKGEASRFTQTDRGKFALKQ
ncbi:MAG TPA: winged helix-turn-helix domain-containing protein [Planctomycetota bacterium]|nr:winged helix-turn-helix domain-containing protein [Planctomycetota bacterium]